MNTPERNTPECCPFPTKKQIEDAGLIAVDKPHFKMGDVIYSVQYVAFSGDSFLDCLKQAKDRAYDFCMIGSLRVARMDPEHKKKVEREAKFAAPYGDPSILSGPWAPFAFAYGDSLAPLDPFVKISMGIPDNWPGDCVLSFDVERGLINLNYFAKGAITDGITINQWRELAKWVEKARRLESLEMARQESAAKANPPTYDPSKDPEMTFDEEIGWVHRMVLVEVNELRQLRQASQKLHDFLVGDPRAIGNTDVPDDIWEPFCAALKVDDKPEPAWVKLSNKHADLAQRLLAEVRKYVDNKGMTVVEDIEDDLGQTFLKVVNTYMENDVRPPTTIPDGTKIKHEVHTSFKVESAHIDALRDAIKLASSVKALRPETINNLQALQALFLRLTVQEGKEQIQKMEAADHDYPATYGAAMLKIKKLEQALIGQKRTIDGYHANMPKCGACAEQIICGSTLNNHSADCPVARAKELETKLTDLGTAKAQSDRTASSLTALQLDVKEAASVLYEIILKMDSGPIDNADIANRVAGALAWLKYSINEDFRGQLIQKLRMMQAAVHAKIDEGVAKAVLPDTTKVMAMVDALRANQVFHTPVALRRRGGQWDEYEIDAINRTREALAQNP